MSTPPPPAAARSTPLRIAQIVRSLDIGGIETFLLYLLPALRRRGLAIELFCIEAGGRAADRLAAEGIPVQILHAKPVTGFRAVQRLTRALKDRGPFDIVHGHGRIAGKTGRIAAKRAGVPGQIIQLHAVRDKMTWRHRIAERLLQKRTDAYVMVSQAVLDAEKNFWRQPLEKAHVIPNGLPLSHYTLTAAARTEARRRIRTELAIPENAFVAGTLARFCADKDLPTLLKGARPWMQQQADAHLLLAGTGPDGDALAALAKELAFPAGRLHWVGYRTDVPELLAALDAFAITSVTESFCLALLEAFQAGVPALTTLVGGIREYVTPGENALAVPVGDPTAVEQALSQLHDDPAVRAKLAANAAKTAQAYDIEEVAEKLHQLYKDVQASHTAECKK
ncbi:MAG TPA: glycosyltransferase [Planctomycetota bacterium]|nr:glycosyltransferase [Planctomycetota bacterium]